MKRGEEAKRVGDEDEGKGKGKILRGKTLKRREVEK